MDNCLIPAKNLTQFEDELKSLINSKDEPSVPSWNDELVDGAFRKYLLFCRWPDLLRKAGLQLSQQCLLYNSYYWMLMFSKYHALKYGFDAGMEQQVFRVLEHSAAEIDWAVIEQITKYVEKETTPVG